MVSAKSTHKTSNGKNDQAIGLFIYKHPILRQQNLGRHSYRNSILLIIKEV